MALALADFGIQRNLWAGGFARGGGWLRSTVVSLWIGAVAAVVMAGPAMAGDMLVGKARVIDGDTLVIRGVHVRLFGMDAFEHDQMCGRFACGMQATVAMQRLAGGVTMTCERKDIDPYGRTVAICKTSAGLDVGGEMVRRGLAVDYRTFSDRYMADERAARAARAGAWAYGFQSPLDFRRSQR